MYNRKLIGKLEQKILHTVISQILVEIRLLSFDCGVVGEDSLQKGSYGSCIKQGPLFRLMNPTKYRYMAPWLSRLVVCGKLVESGNFGLDT